MPTNKTLLATNSEMRKSSAVVLKEDWKKIIPMGLFAAVMVSASCTGALFVWGAVFTGTCSYFLPVSA